MVKLRVVTYNIHRAIGVDRRFRPKRIVNVLNHHQADIVLLQEVDHGAPRSDELDLAKEIACESGYPYYAVGHNVTLRKGRYGNATLSRYPIERERNIDLSVGTRKRRGCQHTLINCISSTGYVHRIEVFNLHLGLSARERARQIGILVKSAEFSSLDKNNNCIIGGDFNDWRTLIPPIFTEILGFYSATDTALGLQSAIRTYPSFSPTGGLDKIFFRGPINLLGARRCRLRTSKVASDHLPVIADFDLRTL
jgi:endonuclease/exonuclease/phosphatase family metal-dependent hydrolase